MIVKVCVIFGKPSFAALVASGPVSAAPARHFSVGQFTIYPLCFLPSLAA